MSLLFGTKPKLRASVCSVWASLQVAWKVAPAKN